MKINTLKSISFGHSEKFKQNIFDIERQNALQQMDNVDEYLTRIEEINFVEKYGDKSNLTNRSLLNNVKKLFTKLV